MSFNQLFEQVLSLPRRALDTMNELGSKAGGNESNSLFYGLVGAAVGIYALNSLNALRKRFDVRNKVVLVTGASSGIGREIAILLAEKGAKVALIARNYIKLYEVHAIIKTSGGESKVFQCDCSNPSSVATMSESVQNDLGVPHVIVNCAGAGKWRFLDELSAADNASMLNAPMLAAMYVTREFLPEMKKRGDGIIANINSPAAFSPWPGSTMYATTRFALRGFSEALATDLRGTGITVTHIILPETDSEYSRNNDNAFANLPFIAKFLPTYTSRESAAEVVYAVERRRHEYVASFLLRLTVLTQWLAPSLVSYLSSYPVNFGVRN